MAEQRETTSFAEQINSAQHYAMQKDDSMLCFGLGIDDPKAIFGTTQGLSETFGNDRVFDMPTSENAMTGVAIGAALSGRRVLMTHQRLDFFLLALDQLVNNAAKWRYMFNGKMQVPLTIRLIIGRGWGQGPTHAQNLQAWFANVPGLRVVVPSKTDAVASQLRACIFSNDPTVFIEHRWLHSQHCFKKDLHDIESPIEAVRLHSRGKHISIITNGFMVLEAVKASQMLTEVGISCEIVDIVMLDPKSWAPVYDSVRKTGNALIVDSAHLHFSLSSELSASITEHCFEFLNHPPIRMGLPEHPEPTSFGMTKDFYPSADTICYRVLELFKKEIKVSNTHTPKLHDVPGSWFNGPF